MYKKCVMLMITGMFFVQIIGCGNKSNQESNEIMQESAVDKSTADSNVKEEADTEKAESTEVTEETISYDDVLLKCNLPKGFKASEDVEGLYIHKSYPKDISTISYVISESTEDITKMEQEEFRKMLEEDYYDSYGDKVSIHFSTYEQIEIDERDALRITLDYEFKGIIYEQLIYMIYNGDETHILNYTQEKDGKWMKEFEKSGESISLKSQE